MSVFRNDLLAGKVALITGGGTGICRGIAEAYAAHGCKTVLVSRKLEVLETTAAEIEERFGQRSVAVAADVRKFDQVEAAVARALEEFGRLDIVTNGAAGNFLCPAAQLSSGGMAAVLNIDTLGSFHVCRAAFDAWLRDHGGCIVNISATLHYAATAMQVHASAAKAAVDAMTRNLAVEWGGLGIRVNGIAPGPIGDTEGVSRLVPEDMRQKMEARIPLRRFGRVDEIAQTALFLASDGALYITGTNITVDGGHWMTAGGGLL